MSLFTNASGLLPGLSQGSFRGVPFEIVDAEHEVGRRIVTHFFPGVDAQAREDQGKLDGPVKVMGLIVGDDYVERAKALEAALGQAGPGTLVHPWLGEMRVVVPAGARIRFSTGELRVARFDIVFEREVERLAGKVSSASRLTSSLGSLRSAAGGLLSSALASRLAPVNALDTAFVLTGTILNSAIRKADTLDNGADLAARLATLLRTVSTDPSASVIASAASSLATAIGAAARARPRPAIGRGGTSAPTTQALPKAERVARMALALADEVGAVTPLIMPERAAIATAQSSLVSAAIEAASLIPFTAREEAYSWRKDLDLKLTTSAQLAASLTDSLPGPASVLARSVRDVRSALYTDFNELIGRLPSTVVVGGGIPALMIAYDLEGDNPGSVLAFASDIITRNRLANPAVTPITGVEVLQ